MWTKWNRIGLLVFGPVLILAGIGGLTLPASASPMSNAVPYDWFHIAFGALGTVIVLARRPVPIALFNLGFGLVDLWQAVAGLTELFPYHVFALRPADHVLHLVVGVALVGLGAMGLRELQTPARA